MKIRLNKRAITRMQGVLIIVILIIIAAVGIYAMTPPPSPGPTPTTTGAPPTTVAPTTKPSKGKFVIDWWYESSGHYPQSADQAAVYKAQLERTGLITVNLHAADWPSYKNNRDAEIMPVYVYGWYPDYLDPDDYVFPFLHSQGGGWLHMNYKNPEIDKLIEQARAISDPAARNDLYAKVQKIMVDDAAIVPVFQSTAWAVTKPDIQGVVLDITQNMYYWLISPPAGKDTLIVGTTDSVETNIDVAEAYDYFGLNVVLNTGAGLVYIKPGSGAGPDDFLPGLATKWSSSSDGLTWTFDLRQGVKFSDGKEFDANAVKYSFDRSLSLYLEDSSQAGIGYRDIIDSVEAASKYQVVFHLKIPFAPFLSLMAFQGSFIVNPKYAPMDSAVNYVEGNARASNPNDLGPYLLTSWTRKAGKDYEMRYDVNPNYWGLADGYPKVKHIIFKLGYSDATALALAIKSGDIDMAFRQLAATDIKSFQADPTVKVWEGTGAFIQYICFQEKIAPFDNPKVRQAIAAALNRKELVDTVFLGQAVPLYSMIPNGMAFHQDAYKVLGDANISLTVSVLQELGYG
jgi:ABC-type transport system substrate-binding protein